MGQKNTQKDEKSKANAVQKPKAIGHCSFLSDDSDDEDLEGIIKRFPLFRYRTPNNESTSANQFCGLCQRPYEDGDCIRILPCAHKFHKNCLDPWLLWASPTCPTDNLSIFRKQMRREMKPPVFKSNSFSNYPVIPPIKKNEDKVNKSHLAISEPVFLNKVTSVGIRQRREDPFEGPVSSSGIIYSRNSVYEEYRQKEDLSKLSPSSSGFNLKRSARAKNMKKDLLPPELSLNRPSSRQPYKIKPGKGYQILPQIGKKLANREKNDSSYDSEEDFSISEETE